MDREHAKEKRNKDRLDKLVVDLGLCATRSKAAALIMAGHVLVNGQKVDKAGTLVTAGSTITVKETLPYVSRGGLKLAYALEHFALCVNGLVCLDVGASTGGFTDCLLQHGARHVYAIDVGQNQLAWTLRQHSQVTTMEKTHILHVEPSVFKHALQFACMDVSFISIKKVLPHVIRLLTAQNNTPPARPLQIVALIKPQFEYGDYYNLNQFNGVVQDPNERQQVLTHTLTDLNQLLPDAVWDGLCTSPIQGPKGNTEYLLCLSINHTHPHTATPWPIEDTLKPLFETSA